MIGAICKRDILAHPLVTIHCFGWQVFFKALAADHDQTFLSVLTQTTALPPPKVRIPQLVDRCVKLELRAKWIYEWLAGRFIGYRPVSRFFDVIARQEHEHSELLELCRGAASRTLWKEENFAPWRTAVPRLERQMRDAEASRELVDDVADALRLVIRIESSEINRVFGGVVAATGAGFVRRLRVFQTSVRDHVSYICDRIPELEPELAGPCRDLRDRTLGTAEP